MANYNVTTGASYGLVLQALARKVTEKTKPEDYPTVDHPVTGEPLAPLFSLKQTSPVTYEVKSVTIPKGIMESVIQEVQHELAGKNN